MTGISPKSSVAVNENLIERKTQMMGIRWMLLSVEESNEKINQKMNQNRLEID